MSSVKAPTVGYVGLDHHHAEPYLQTLSTLPATVVAACEPNPAFDADGVDALDDVPVYGDVETLLARESPDVVFLTLPNRDTPDAIRRAVAAGCDVFTEKPAARTAGELEALRDDLPASATVCVSYPWQSHPIARELRDRVDDGFFGEMRAFDARFIASKLDYRDADHFIFDPDASRGGILQWLGIHWLQLFTRLLEAPIRRVNAATTAGTDGVAVEDGVSLQLETATGGLGTLQAGYYLAEGVYDTRFDLYGEDGASRWDPMGREFGFTGETSLELEDSGGRWGATPHRTITHDYEPAPGYGGSWGREFVEAFFDSRAGGEPPVTVGDALDVLRITDAAYDSARTGEWVEVAGTDH
ncbi:Gfo/Idh/MocA family protein [Saliphagus infecundisoli]|uniref:Gfo/Idh/MocA family protein n=1 Tax=Saliphagus infecundisoli TaxID=1849069 RepID=A0ABD5Q9S4_9EURY|nr:Gfo/Idh/MocA family oxidoreductase [Saliphagus infecundisoli]